MRKAIMVLGACLALFPGSTLVGTSPAVANQTNTYYYQTGDKYLYSTDAADGVSDGYMRVLAETDSIQLGAGESRLITGHAFITSTTAGGREVQIGVGCPGDPSLGTARTSRNHEGNDTPAGLDQSSGSYPAIGYVSQGKLALRVYYLFKPDLPGTYTCRLYGYSSEDQKNIAHGGIGNSDAGWIRVTTTSLNTGEQWVVGDNNSGEPGPCNSTGTLSTCVYLVRSSANSSYPDTIRAFDGGFDPEASFTPSLLATKVNVFNDLAMTTCPQNTASCISAVSQYGGSGSDTIGTVATRLEVNQLTVSGDSCGQVSYFPKPGQGSDASGNYWKFNIRRAAHHFKAHHFLTHALVDDGLGPCTNNLKVTIFVRALSGDPIKLDAGRQTRVIVTNDS